MLQPDAVLETLCKKGRELVFKSIVSLANDDGAPKETLMARLRRVSGDPSSASQSLSRSSLKDLQVDSLRKEVEELKKNLKKAENDANVRSQAPPDLIGV